MNTRPAEVGDKGVLLGVERHGSVATLTIHVGEDELAYLHGDWRVVSDLAEAFGGERVEVVEVEGSAYGAHGILPLVANG